MAADIQLTISIKCDLGRGGSSREEEKDGPLRCNPSSSSICFNHKPPLNLGFGIIIELPFYAPPKIACFLIVTALRTDSVLCWVVCGMSWLFQHWWLSVCLVPDYMRCPVAMLVAKCVCISFFLCAFLQCIFVVLQCWWLNVCLFMSMFQCVGCADG